MEMTENEAIIEIKRWTRILMDTGSQCVSETAEAQETATRALEEIKQYHAIGTVEECKEAMERQRAKKPEHFYKKHGKHKWRRKENGEIDNFAWEFDYHNGVACEICGETVCVHCNPNYDELDDCEEEYWNCPNCGEMVGWKSKYCDCGQAIGWSDTD